MNLAEREAKWFKAYTVRAPHLSEDKRREMARWAAARGEEPPLDYEEPRKSLKEIVIHGVGYIGAAEAWDLKRRLIKGGGLQRMIDATVKGSTGAKIGGAALICTGAGGVLTSVGCMLHSLIGGNFMVDAMACWQGILLGCAAVGAGYVALGLGSAVVAVVETTKAAAVLQVAISPEPPTPTPEAGVGTREIKEALAIVTAPVVPKT